MNEISPHLLGPQQVLRQEISPHLLGPRQVLRQESGDWFHVLATFLKFLHL